MDETSSSKPGGGSGEQDFEIPWVEKYRPRVLEEVVGNEEAISRLAIIAKEGNLPNIILSGPPGIGKTTAILALARTMLGDACPEAVLELNASDDRGIDVVRSNIKMFAQKKVTLPTGRQKLIILDEADSMTSAAQQALRRTMEVHSNTTRFALACNFSNEIIEAIQSRCAVVRFTRLSDKQVLQRILKILQAEEVPFTDDGLEAILFTAEGDMRQAINNSQATSAGFGSITQDNVFKVVDQPHPVVLKEVTERCIAGRLEESSGLLRKLSVAQGYTPNDIVTTLSKVVRMHEMPEALKLEFLRELGLTHAVMAADGVDTVVQLAGLAGRLCLLGLEHSSSAKT